MYLSTHCHFSGFHRLSVANRLERGRGILLSCHVQTLKLSMVYFQYCILFHFAVKFSQFLSLIMADEGASRTCTLWRVAFLIILRRKVLWDGLGICLYLIPVSLSHHLPTKVMLQLRQARLTKHLRILHLLDATYATHNSMNWGIEIVPTLTVISFFCKFLPSFFIY